jgi:hypothetical protein
VDEGHDDYAEPGGSRRPPLPAVILWVCVGLVALTIFAVAWLQAIALAP